MSKKSFVEKKTTFCSDCLKNPSTCGMNPIVCQKDPLSKTYFEQYEKTYGSLVGAKGGI